MGPKGNEGHHSNAHTVSLLTEVLTRFLLSHVHVHVPALWDVGTAIRHYRNWNRNVSLQATGMP